MTSDSSLPVSNTNISSNSSTPLSLINSYSQVRLKSEGDKVLLILSTEDENIPTQDFSEGWQELKYRLNGSKRSWQPGTAVHLIAKDRLLDARQLQSLAEALSEVELQLKSIQTNRRQTAVVAATAGYSVEQNNSSEPLVNESQTPEQELAEPLCLQTTVRSGVEVRHPGTVIILGDLNPGGNVVAAGDILVWGRLRGIAHAGAQGNRECRIMALQMQPTQLRIADAVARAPEKSPTKLEPEVAYITTEGIRLTKAVNFSKTYSFSQEVGGWTDWQESTSN